MEPTNSQFDNTDVDFSGLLSQSIQKIQALCSKWTSITPGDPGMVIVELLCCYTDILKRYNDFAIQNNSVRDATLLKQIYSFAALVGTSVKPKISASVPVTFTAKTGLGTYPVYVPRGTQVKTSNGITFETSVDLYIPESTKVGTVLCTEGTTQSGVSIGGSDGTSYQRKKISSEPIAFANGSYQIDIDVQESGNMKRWTYVPSLATSKAMDRNYTLEFTDDGVFVLFGDNKTGMVPPPSADGGITATYRIGGGSRGLVDKNTLTLLADPALYNSIEAVTNPSKAYGAVEGDDIETARNNIPAYTKTNERAIAPSDFKVLAERYGGIALARPFAIAQTVFLFVVPATGGDLEQGLKDNLTTYLLSVSQQGYIPQVMQANYKTVDISVEIKIKRGWQQSVVQNAVKNNLVSLLNPTSQSPTLTQETGVNNTQRSSLFINDFGADLHIDAIYTIIRNTPGVEYSNITKMLIDDVEVPIANISVEDYEIIRGGSAITVDLIQGELQEYAAVYDPTQETQTI